MKGSKLKNLVKKAGIEEKDLEKNTHEWKSFISNLSSEETKFAKLARKMLQNRGHANISADRRREKLSVMEEKIKNLERLVMVLTSPLSAEDIPDKPVPDDTHCPAHTEEVLDDILLLIDVPKIPDTLKNII